MRWRVTQAWLACAAIALLFTTNLRADERTQRLAQRLTEEASAFARLAPQLIGEETLHQRALKAPPRFKPRIGDAAREKPKPSWQERALISEYTLALFSGDDASAGAGTFQELRQVTTVDGKIIADSRKAQDMLAKAVTSTDDQRRLQLLKDFERHGLLGAVTGVGPMLLLFSGRELPRYEILYLREEYQGAARLLVFSYRQIDGEGLSVFDVPKSGPRGDPPNAQPADQNNVQPIDKPRRMQIYGEIWVREVNYMPVRITLAASQGEGATLIREEARVDYVMSEWGVLVPQSAEHRELRAGNPVAENRFEYAPFRKFGASSDIQFQTAPGAPVFSRK
jgi:hypothetical protein